jgi:hypothetical protein
MHKSLHKHAVIDSLFFRVKWWNLKENIDNLKEENAWIQKFFQLKMSMGCAKKDGS